MRTYKERWLGICSLLAGSIFARLGGAAVQLDVTCFVRAYDDDRALVDATVTAEIAGQPVRLKRAEPLSVAVLLVSPRRSGQES